jgi:glutamate racemase
LSSAASLQQNNPIGIFDSGIGGLTVVKQLMHLLPNENLVYFGDTARVPYGTRSEKLIRQYALEDAAFLEQFSVKYLIVACNTVSAVAVDLLSATREMPVTGVIIPGVEGAIRETRNGRIGVMGTRATIESKAYNRRITERNPELQVFGAAAPLLVPMIEEGWLSEEVTRLTVRNYLRPLLEENIDTLILGCTHFPVIRDLIQEEAGDVTLIDSGLETARQVKILLGETGLLNSGESPQQTRFFVSDIPRKFDEVGTRFLGHPVVNATRIDFDEFLMEKGDTIYKSMNLSEQNG